MTGSVCFVPLSLVAVSVTVSLSQGNLSQMTLREGATGS
jgi:hypothetical protein